jgi:superfamily II RNA helicase
LQRINAYNIYSSLFNLEAKTYKPCSFSSILMAIKYKGFTLDKFQEDSIASIDRGNSVVVSAATGTGKTLIADYIVEKAIKEGWHVIYTAPIKALSNQKFKDFKADYGDKIGLLTGDIVINPNAPIRIMTTEIYRNMLVDNEPMDALKYVIFDEIHFLNDPERGTVWEESIIFSPENVRFLCLSATIPNYDQFADWISTIKGHTVDTVNYSKRAVPLVHQLYDYKLGLTDIKSLSEDLENDNYPKYSRYGKRPEKRKKRYEVMAPDHKNLIRELHAKDWLPCIFFVFSRKATFERAGECAKKFNFTTPEEKARIIDYFNANVKEEIRHMQSVQKLKYFLTRGVGVHNAGIFPNLKEIVEYLFCEGLIRVLYATETFAVGINMPARTVCFGSLQKYDGISFRYLKTKEYFQLAGRAGRRGIDKEGRSITIIDRFKIDVNALEKVMGEDVEPIESQFKLSYNTVLNIMKNYDAETRQIILQSNFGYFVKKQSARQSRIMTSFSNYTRRLEMLGYLNKEKLTWKGEFATHIYTYEIPISELIFGGLFKTMTDEQMVLTLTALMYEGRPSDHFVIKGANVGRIISIVSRVRDVKRAVNFNALKRLYNLIHIWFNGGQFDQVMDICNLAEGDVIRLLRQVLDMISQIKHGLIQINDHEELVHRLESCQKKIDRDLVAVEF